MLQAVRLPTDTTPIPAALTPSGDRFRNVRDSDEERRVLRAALDTFGVPMLEFFRKLDQFADQQAGNKARAARRGSPPRAA